MKVGDLKDVNHKIFKKKCWLVGWLVVFGKTALLDSISVYIGPSPKEREKEKRKDRGE